MIRRAAFALAGLGLFATPLVFVLLPHTRPTVAGTPDLTTSLTMTAFLALPWAIVLVMSLRGRTRLALTSGLTMLVIEVAALALALRHAEGTLAALIYLFKPAAQILLGLPLGGTASWLIGLRSRRRNPAPQGDSA